ncbi:MAG: PD-(D/E)XK nuclease family transposase [Cyanobacteria bacterium J06623_4]
MAFPLQERYVNLLTDFGFKRVFGSEPNKQLLVDFLNTLLPSHHQISELSYKSTENLGSASVDRKAVFDLYCQGANGERFIVELQKAKQKFFKDRSLFYATFPIQEHQDPVFLQLFEIAEIANFSRSEQDSYQSSLKYYRDLNNVIDTSRQEGVAEGIEQGRKLEQVKIARSLLGKLPVAAISETTGLSIKEIEKLMA